jgi:hypothetical protein
MRINLDDDQIDQQIASLKQWIQWRHERIKDWEVFYNDTDIPRSKKDIIESTIAQTMLLPQNN